MPKYLTIACIIIVLYSFGIKFRLLNNKSIHKTKSELNSNVPSGKFLLFGSTRKLNKQEYTYERTAFKIRKGDWYRIIET